MITIFLLSLSALYVFFLLYLIYMISLPLPKTDHANTAFPALSVVIPFKNEELHLPALLTSLLNLRYDNTWEVVLVNDDSTDSSLSIVNGFADRFGDRLSLVNSDYSPAVRLTSKQQALDAGVARSLYDWIVFTDADMEFDTDWLDHLGAQTARGADLVFGHTSIRYEIPDSFLRFQRFQLEFLFAAAYAFSRAGIDSSCMGNNILIRKEAYTAIGGQRGIGYSIVEDRDLYKTLLQKKYRVAAAEPFTAKAFTAPCTSAKQYYHQLLRWARGGLSHKSTLLWSSLLFAAHVLLFFISLGGFAEETVFAASSAGVFITALFIAYVFNKNGTKESVLFLPVYYVFVAVAAILLPLTFVISPKVIWKSKKL